MKFFYRRKQILLEPEYGEEEEMHIHIAYIQNLVSKLHPTVMILIDASKYQQNILVFAVLAVRVLDYTGGTCFQ